MEKKIFKLYNQDGSSTKNSNFLEGYISGLLEAGFTVNWQMYNKLFKDIYVEAPVFTIEFHAKNVVQDEREKRIIKLFSIGIFPSTTEENAFKVRSVAWSIPNKDVTNNHINISKLEALVDDFNEKYKDKLFYYDSDIECCIGIQWIIRTQLNRIQQQLRIEQPEWGDVPLLRRDIDKGYTSFYETELKEPTK